MAWIQQYDMDGGAGGWYNSETKQFSPGWTDPATGRVYPEQPTTGVSATSGGQVRPNGWTYQPATHGTMDSQGDEQPGYWWNQQGQKWTGDENTPPPVDSLTNLGRVQEGSLNGFLQQGSDGKYYISGKPDPVTSYTVNGQTIPLDDYHAKSMVGSTGVADAQSVAAGKRSDTIALMSFGALAGAGALGYLGSASAYGADAAAASGAGMFGEVGAGSEFAYGGAQAIPAESAVASEFAYGGAQVLPESSSIPSVPDTQAPAPVEERAFTPNKTGLPTTGSPLADSAIKEVGKGLLKNAMSETPTAPTTGAPSSTAPVTSFGTFGALDLPSAYQNLGPAYRGSMTRA